MKPVSFNDLPDEALFWMSEHENPTEPWQFKGPYKKKVYVECRDVYPDVVFIREEGRWSASHHCAN